MANEEASAAPEEELEGSVTSTAVADATADSQVDASQQAAEAQAAQDIADELGLGQEWRGKDAAEIARHLHKTAAERDAEYKQTLSDRQINAYKYGRDQILQDPSYAEYQEWKKQQAEAQKQTPKEKNWWKPPEYNEALARKWLETGDDGQLRFKEGTPPDVQTQVTSYLSYVDSHVDKLRRNPVEHLTGWAKEYLPEILPDVAGDFITQKVNEILGQTAEQRELEDFYVRNGDWIYVTDEKTGQPVIDPQTGKWAVTPEGLAYNQSVAEIMQATGGQLSKAKAHSLAMKMFRGQLAQMQLAETTKALDSTKQSADARTEHARRAAARTANVAGRTKATEHAPSTTDRSLHDQLVEQWAIDGVQFDEA